ncbi:MAG: hypothetical protein RIS84_1476, partial [Pseudomonadota bacterium]
MGQAYLINTQNRSETFLIPNSGYLLLDNSEFNSTAPVVTKRSPLLMPSFTKLNSRPCISKIIFRFSKTPGEVS